jgi:predicted small integral membrane protein
MSILALILTLVGLAFIALLWVGVVSSVVLMAFGRMGRVHVRPT